MNLVSFKKRPILGILRGVKIDIIEPLIEAVISAGLETLEITMNTADAPELISKAKKICRNRLTLGAGTVLTMQDLKLALQSGASFIVMPVLVKDIVEYCLNSKIPVFPGAFTPQEVYQAHKAGATMVKVFPAKFFGPEYIRELKGPFNDIELLVQERGLKNKHLFEHLIELYRISGIINSNFKEKPPVKQTLFRIDPNYFGLLKNAIEK